jgi:hypothetical protein
MEYRSDGVLVPIFDLSITPFVQDANTPMNNYAHP